MHQIAVTARVAAVWRLLTQPSNVLSHRVVHAGLWAYGLRGTQAVFGTVRTIVLARLLAPDDFGLMGIALIVMAFLDSFTQTGFRNALVQRKEDIRPYLNAAWTLEVTRATIVAATLVLAAPLIADFFGTDAATPIVRAMAGAIFLNGLLNIGIVFFEKELEFQKRFILQALPTLMDLIVGISLAIALKNVWALVFGVTAGNATRLAASYVLHPYRPRFTWDLPRTRELYRFGRWVLLSNMITFAATRGDSAIVGRMLGATALGVYEMARKLTELTTKQFATISGTIAFPAYAMVQSDLVRLRRAYFSILDVVASIVLPMATGMGILASLVASVILGPQWDEITSVLPFLMLAGAIRAIGATGGALYQGTGHPQLDFRMNALRVITLFALVIPFVNWFGLLGAAIAVLTAASLILPFFCYQVAKITQTSIVHVIGQLLPALALTGMIAAMAFAFRYFLPAETVAALIAAITSLSLTYIVGVILLFKIKQRGPLRAIQAIRARR